MLNTFSRLIHQDLPESEALAFLGTLVPDEVSDADLAAFVAELQQTGLAFPPLSKPVMDCCGTGGSGLAHFNTSSTVAFVLAAAGVPVVKFGNRGMSSASGSFDFLEALGVPLETPPERVTEWFDQTGLLFLYAPQWYPALAPFNTLRKRLGHKTIFNYLGPLLNPAKPQYRLLGVSSQAMAQRLAHYLAQNTATTRAWVVSSQRGLDELDVESPTMVYGVHSGTCEPALEVSPPVSIALPSQPQSVAQNVATFKAIVQGEDTQSPWYHLVTLNAGAGLVVAGQALDLAEGMALAQTLLAQGAVQSKWQEVQKAYAQHSR